MCVSLGYTIKFLKDLIFIRFCEGLASIRNINGKGKGILINIDAATFEDLKLSEKFIRQDVEPKSIP